MKVLAFDPGAKRMGWCVLAATPEEVKEKKPPTEYGGGIYRLERERNESSGEDEAFQKYRLRLIDYWIETTNYLLDGYKPDCVVAEIVPAVGSGNFRSGATQSQLAETAITTAFVVSRSRSLDVAQVGATSVKARVGGGRKATKVGVRNGVYRFMPETKAKYHTMWKEDADMSDAYAIGLTYLGYDVRKD